MHWAHKDLLDVSQLSTGDVERVFEAADSFMEINRRPVKKVPTLKGRSVVLFFAEPSTRTKTSFDMAGKRLSADTFSLASSSSSLTKGESLKGHGADAAGHEPRRHRAAPQQERRGAVHRRAARLLG